MRAGLCGGAVTVSILDHGVGFDPGSTPPGTGLSVSVRRRIRDVGGTVAITSAPGAGTHVELAVPLACGPLPGNNTTRQVLEDAV